LQRFEVALYRCALDLLDLRGIDRWRLFKTLLLDWRRGIDRRRLSNTFSLA
jgi:hypothetical protein